MSYGCSRKLPLEKGAEMARAGDSRVDIERVSTHPHPERPVLDLEEALQDDNDRYSRLRLIPWWDQERLAGARVMVVGAGALGNEILKNLALLGVGHIYVVDFDVIENSNLSRSVLYRPRNEGAIKAEVAARAVAEINPDCRVYWLNGNVAWDIGLGLFRRMDVVIGGLDNREARLAINQACWRVNVPWVDGAIEVLFGVARVFWPPHSACYECTMTEQDYRLLHMRRSCALLSRQEMLAGKVPTTPTTAAVIAGIQVQEAVKILHNRPDLPTLAGKGFFFNGLTHDSYVVEYARKEFCPSHECFEPVVAMQRRVSNTTAAEMLALAQDHLGAGSLIELHRELVVALHCGHCRSEEKLIQLLGRLGEKEARCPQCGEVRRPVLTHALDGEEDFLDLTLDRLGIPPLDIISARHGLEMIHFEFSGDWEEDETKAPYPGDGAGFAATSQSKG